MQENEILDRMKDLCAARSWTIYRLAKESGVAYSTLCTILHRGKALSIPTLIKICRGFGITLSQFFDKEDESVLFTAVQREHMGNWDKLTPENQTSAEKYIHYLLSQQ